MTSSQIFFYTFTPDEVEVQSWKCLNLIQTLLHFINVETLTEKDIFTGELWDQLEQWN